MCSSDLVATTHTACGQPRTAGCAVDFEGLERVLRTARDVSTGREVTGSEHLIAMNGPSQESIQHETTSSATTIARMVSRSSLNVSKAADGRALIR